MRAMAGMSAGAACQICDGPLSLASWCALVKLTQGRDEAPFFSARSGHRSGTVRQASILSRARLNEPGLTP